MEMLNRQLEKQLWGSRERPRDIALGISIYWEVIKLSIMSCIYIKEFCKLGSFGRNPFSGKQVKR